MALLPTRKINFDDIYGPINAAEAPDKADLRVAIGLNDPPAGALALYIDEDHSLTVNDRPLLRVAAILGDGRVILDPADVDIGEYPTGEDFAVVGYMEGNPTDQVLIPASAMPSGGGGAIADGAVTLAKMANISQRQLYTRTTAGTGVPQMITTSADVFAMLQLSNYAAVLSAIGAQAAGSYRASATTLAEAVDLSAHLSDELTAITATGNQTPVVGASSQGYNIVLDPSGGNQTLLDITNKATGPMGGLIIHKQDTTPRTLAFDAGAFLALNTITLSTVANAFTIIGWQYSPAVTKIMVSYIGKTA